jgi:hypothetical protein
MKCEQISQNTYLIENKWHESRRSGAQETTVVYHDIYQNKWVIEKHAKSCKNPSY